MAERRRRRRAEMPEATRCSSSSSSGAESGSDCSMDTEAVPKSGRRRHKVPGKGSGYGLAAPARWGRCPAGLAGDGGRSQRRWRGPGQASAAFPRGGPGRAATCAGGPGRGLAACRGGPAGRAGPGGAGRDPGTRSPRHPERGRPRQRRPGCVVVGNASPERRRPAEICCLVSATAPVGN